MNKMGKEDIIEIECMNCKKIRKVNKMIWKEGKTFKCDCGKERFERRKEKSLYDYKLGEVVERDLMNSVMESPNKLVAISYTFQSKDGVQMESILKHKDFLEKDE